MAVGHLFALRGWRRNLKKTANRILETGLVTWLGLLGLWQLLALFNSADFLPGPWATFLGAIELARDGSLARYTGISLARVLTGWTSGIIIAVPIGILMGRITFLRLLIEPVLNFVRFVPPIAFVTLFLLWFGIGETSKVVLILYATLFTVVLNTLTGVLSIPEDRMRSARIMGANEVQIVLHVILPTTVPYIFTGVRLAMGTSFMAIIGAEMIAANEGLGYMIWNARLYFKTDWIFVGLVILGMLGFLTDRLISVLGRRLLSRYGVVTGTKIKRQRFA
jgi:ABC-type nitrate/sulfonate/bicarbonate transport system permease component